MVSLGVLLFSHLFLKTYTMERTKAHPAAETMGMMDLTTEVTMRKTEITIGQHPTRYFVKVEFAALNTRGRSST